jgi:hypothetical protein
MPNVVLVRRCDGLPYVRTRELTSEEQAVLALRRSRAKKWAWLWVASAGVCLVVPALIAAGVLSGKGAFEERMDPVVGCILGLFIFALLAAHMFSWARMFRTVAETNAVEVYEGPFLDLEEWEDGRELDTVVKPGRSELALPHGRPWRNGKGGRVLTTTKAVLSLVADVPSPLPQGDVALSESESAEFGLHCVFMQIRHRRAWGTWFAMLIGLFYCVSAGWVLGGVMMVAAVVISLGTQMKRTRHLKSMEADLADGKVEYNEEERIAVLPHSGMHWVICGVPAPWRFDQWWLKFTPQEGKGKEAEEPA